MPWELKTYKMRTENLQKVSETSMYLNMCRMPAFHLWMQWMSISWVKWMSKEDILNTFRSELTTEAAKKIRDMQQTADSTSPTYLVRYVGKPAEPNLRADNLHTGILAGLEAHSGWPGDYDSIEPIKNYLIPVYEVEWIEVDYKTGELTRHEGVKIGSEVYITRGESKYIVRSADCPSRCRLSVNGIFFLDKNGDPYSLIAHTMDLQD